ncbi:MAG: hypothetical protein LBG21_07560 [Campylobacteraceae bacterium]|nr:hypothetical protein [Campylobacteraceae bacterium]
MDKTDILKSMGYKIDGGTCHLVDIDDKKSPTGYAITLNRLFSREQGAAFLENLLVGQHSVTFLLGGTDNNACDSSKLYSVIVTREPSLIINSVAVNNGNPIPAEATSASIVVNATVIGGNWWETAVVIDGNYSNCYSVDTNNRAVGTHVNTFDNTQSIAFVEKLPIGKHNVTFYAAGNTFNACEVAYKSPPFTIEVEKRGLTFDCQHLYIGGENNRNQKNYAEVTVSNTNTFTGVDFPVKNQDTNPTLAIGPYKDSIAFYWWNYDMRTSANSGSGSSSPIYYMQNGSGTSAPIPQNPSSINFETSRLSGGTVNQKTGEIYLLPEPGSNKDKIINILAPGSNGVFTNSKRSARLNFTANTGEYAYASDAAIDGDGNAYLLVNTAVSGKSPVYKLVKVTPNDDWNGSWEFDTVEMQNYITTKGTSNKLWGMAFLNGKLYAAEDTALGSARIHVIDPLKGGETVYNTVTMESGTSPYGYGIDDLASCQTASAITGRVYLDINGDGKIDDNDKDKTTGKYYFVSDVVVEIYDSPTGKPLGYQQTNSLGEYSFLVELQKTYYIRLRQPQINGANTRQTWASGGEFEWKSDIGIGSNGINTVTPECYNGGTKINDTSNNANGIKWYSGKEWKRRYTQDCYGAKKDGIDLSLDGISNANYYTKVVMKTDLSVAHADFALAAVDRSDAPNRKIGNVTYNFGEAAHVLLSNTAYLGAKADGDINSFTSNTTKDDDMINAKGDDNDGVKDDDDGIEVKEANNSDPNAFRTIKGKEFVNGRLYNFRVKVLNNKNYLNAWASFANGNTLAKHTFVNTDNNVEAGRFITNSFVNNGGNYTKLVYNNGYLEFNYTIPDTFYEGEKNSDNNTTKAYMRFRYSNTSIDDMSFEDAKRSNEYWNTKPWAIDGEVEDYMVYYHYIPRPQFVPANLTVVNQNFDGKSEEKFDVDDHNTMGLFTQIAKKSFKAKIVAHNDGKVLKQFDNNVTVIIDFVNNQSICDPQNVIVLENLGNITLNENDIRAVVTQINTTLGKVTRNGTFMLTYYYSQYNGSYNTTTCSDDFALRPAEFKVEGLSGNLVGRKIENGTIKALDYYNGTTLNYDQSANKITHKNSTLVPYSSDCNTTEFNTAVSNAALQINTTDFKAGKSDINILYENIGEMSTSFIDNNWTQIDNYPQGKIYDCIPNSSSNDHSTSDLKGRVGCDIAFDTTLKFVPKTFTSSISISNFDGNYTYLSNNNSMYANIFVDISALLYDNSIATNYHQNCFSRDVFYDVNLTNENLTDWDNRSNVTQRIEYFTTTSTANVRNSKNETANLITSQGNFTNGMANTAFGFNFRRFKAEKPFTVAYNDFNITSIKDSDNVFGSGVAGGDGNASLYYGRTHSKYPVYSVYGNQTNATIYYEIYCSNCNKARYTNGMKLDSEYPAWYINANHNAEKAGNVTKFDPNKGKVYLKRDTSSNHNKSSSFNVTSGSEILGVIKEPAITYTPYSVKIKMIPHSWLTDDPEFEVIFRGGGGDWAGYGQSNLKGETKNATGRIIQPNPSKNIDIRIDW